MRRIILYLTVATTSFAIGVAANCGINMLGGFAVDELCDVAPMAEFQMATVIANPELALARVSACDVLVVVVDRSGSVSYGEVLDLIGAIKEAGAGRIGLVADLPARHND